MAQSVLRDDNPSPIDYSTRLHRKKNPTPQLALLLEHHSPLTSGCERGKAVQGKKKKRGEEASWWCHGVQGKKGKRGRKQPKWNIYHISALQTGQKRGKKKGPKWGGSERKKTQPTRVVSFHGDMSVGGGEGTGGEDAGRPGGKGKKNAKKTERGGGGGGLSVLNSRSHCYWERKRKRRSRKKANV